MSDSLTIKFAYDANTGISDKEVIIEVKDYSTNSAIAGAKVVISGPSYNFTGTTDTNGRINLGVISPGEYQIVTTATNYMSSNEDFLANDRFVI